MGFFDKIGKWIGNIGKRSPGQVENVEAGKELPPGEHKLWKERLTRSKSYLDAYFKVADKMRHEYLGPHDACQEDSTDIPGKPVNLIASFVHTTMPGLFTTPPEPVVEPKRGNSEESDFVEGAKLSEARLRDLHRRKHNMVAMQRAVLDAFWLAGFVATSWVPHGSVRIEVPDNASDEEDGTQEALSTGEVSMTPDEVFDEPVISHIPYKMIRMDTDSKSMEHIRWGGWRDVRLVRELMADDREFNENGIYVNTKELTGGDVPDGEPGQDASGRDKLTTTYTLFEHGREPGELHLVTLAGPKMVTIRSDFIYLGTESLPLQSLSFHDVGRLLPASPEQFWFDQHDSLNEFLTEMTERARQTKNIVVVPENQPLYKKAIVDAKGGDVITAPDPGAAKNLQIGGVPGDTAAIAETMERMADKISGTSDFQRGVESAGAEASATEIVARSDYAKSRLVHWQGFVNRFVEAVDYDMLGMMFRFQWQNVPVRIEDGPADQRYENFSKDSVPGSIKDYKITVDVGEAFRNTPALRQKRTQDVLHLLSDQNLQAFAQSEGKQFSVVAALRDHLRAIGVNDVDRYILDLPDPRELAAQQQQQAMMENEQMMQSGQPVPADPENDDHQIHTQVHMQQAEMSPAIAEHMAEHYAYLEMMAQAGGGQVDPMQMQGDNTLQMSQGLREPPPEEAGIATDAMQLT